MRFDVEGLFDDDYLYFYEDRHSEERTNRESDLISRLLNVDRGTKVLDLACGHGRIANRLAASGCDVTGLDVTPGFLDLARNEARLRGVQVEYVHGDMRQVQWESRFDRAICWFTAFGYFEDSDNKDVLRRVRASLRSGGRFLIHLENRDRLVRNFRPDAVVSERGGDIMVDRSHLELLTNRIVTERIIVRSGKVRRIPFFVRLFTFTEIRDWLLDSGFIDVTVYDEEGMDYNLDSRCMIVMAEC